MADFTITTSNSWPTESYVITPSTYNALIVRGGGSMKAQNLFRFINEPLNDIGKITLNYSQNVYSYGTSRYYYDRFTGVYKLSSTTPQNTTFTWSPETFRRFNVGSIFNYFHIDFQNIELSRLPGLSTDKTPVFDYRSYLLYPQRLFLRPISASVNPDGSFHIATSTIFLQHSSIFISTSASEAQAYSKHLEYMSRQPATHTLRANPATPITTFNLVYNISAAKYVVDNTLLTYSESNNPVAYNTFLESPDVVLRPDSTFIKYSNVTYFNNGSSLIAQEYPDEVPYLNHGFRSSYNLNYNLTNPRVQTFQLVQSSLNVTIPIDDITNSILNTTINLSSTFLSYQSYYYVDSNNQQRGILRVIPGRKLKVQYIAESPNYFNTSIALTSNTSMSATSGSVSAFNIVLNDTVGTNFDRIFWRVPHSPHYYSFKASFRNAGFPNLAETSNLNFALSTWPVMIRYSSGSSISSVQLSSCLSTDFNFLNLDLRTYAKEDLISYRIIDFPSENSFILQSLSCMYGNGTQLQTYDIINSPYVPASAATFLTISYPVSTHGEFDLTIRPRLSSTRFDYYSDSPNARFIKFAQGVSQQNVGYPIFLKILNEQPNQITLDASHMKDYPNYPGRDLRNSYISWKYDSNSPYQEEIVLQALDSNNNVLSSIPFETPLLFDENSWTVRLSGYGPEMASLTLSSQKYNESTTAYTLTGLSNYFYENKFKIGSLPIEFSNNSAIITLTAGVPFDGKIYSIPDNIPLYWIWSYDDILDSNVEAFYPVSGVVPYIYGGNNISNALSSIRIKVNLQTSTNPFTIHNLKVSAVSHFSINKPIVGDFNLTLQDYPEANLFVTDFTTTYQGYSSVVIADTRLNQKTVTRPNTDLKTYKFNAYNDLLPQITSPRIQWTITNNLGNVFTLSSSQFSNISSVNYTLASNATSAHVTLSALSATILGWENAYNLSTSLTIYILPSSTFNTKTEFLVAPPYTWLQGNSGYITLIDQNNFTLAFAPTAYGNKNSNSQEFYVSANKDFDIYKYTFGSSQSALPEINSRLCAIELPYNSELFASSVVINNSSFGGGCLISLTAYNQFFPETNGITFTGLNASGLYVGSFPITAKTIPFDYNFSPNTIENFKKSPLVIPYEFVNLAFSTVDVYLEFDYNVITQQNVVFDPITAIDLDYNVFVGIVQTLSPINSAGNPVRSIQDLEDGVVTYILESPNWTYYIDIPASNGIYQLFNLSIGDATKPLNINPYVYNTLKLRATATFPIQIPDSTFGLLSLSDYDANRDLWSKYYQEVYTEPLTIVAYSTSIRPEIFISSYYNIINEPLFIQFKTPEEAIAANNFSITSYNIYFGDGLSGTYLIDDTVYHSYESKGVYNISYDLNYSDGRNQSYVLTERPITVLEKWPTYDQTQIRLLSEATLVLPWSLDQIYIQPNEFGDADIFNNAIERLHENLEYLKNNSQTINTETPTVYYGWLGVDDTDLSKGFEWHTPDYENDNYVNIDFANSFGFSNIESLTETDQHMYVLDNSKLRVFESGKAPKEIFFDNYSEISNYLLNPVSLSVDKERDVLYVADSIKNKIYKFNFSFGFLNQINLQLNVGNFGEKDDPNKFNTPNEILFIKDNVYVLDYNNLCVKQYTQDLNWVHTYYTDEFGLKTTTLSGSKALDVYFDRPELMAVHPETLFLYVLTTQNNVYVFDFMGSQISNFSLPEVSRFEDFARKMIFDEGGDFLYIITKSTIYKYTVLGTLIGTVTIPNSVKLLYNTATSTSKRSILVATPNAVIKFQDVVTLYKIGAGLPYQYWTIDQLYVYKDELVQDVSYNRALTRLCQNLKTFRSLLDSKFILATEQTSYGTITYYAKTPIVVTDRPVFSEDIENEEVKVGVNEFNIPQVLNREFEKIYRALEILRNELSITNVSVLSSVNAGCSDPFCWSWKAMSCYNLSLPVIRICNINPITYAELEADFPNSYVFSSTKTWGEATAECCDEISSPLG